MSRHASLEVSDNDIAVIGMAARLPGAKNTMEYWRNLVNGVECVTALTDDELQQAGTDRELIEHPDYVKSGVILDGMGMFDAGFFGFSPREASIMDPQHRHFLECSWEALENAGHTPDGFAGMIGVFAGCGMNAYLMFNLLTNPQLLQSTGLFMLRHTGNDKDFLATRVSYSFDLRGPSVNIQTACSTSLVATHVAVQNLLSGECDLALAGGVTIEIPHRQGYLYKEGEILSPDGHCRAFDHKSRGTIFGSGAGVVVLRRLADAIEDGDCIRAVIKGSAINNDGSMKVGYLAPSVEGQADAISEALAIANVDPNTITYVEMHGTGTPIGDPIEVAALTQAFRGSNDKKGFCRIGSVKTNIGHLDTAAGIAGLIKTVLALENKQIPPSLNFEKPNPKIDFENSPFRVNTELVDWKSNGTRRRAGVNSLGVGGTNAHVVLEEAPTLEPTSASRSHQLLLLSARSDGALDAATSQLAAHLEHNPNGSLADTAFTLQVGRKMFQQRRILVCRDSRDAIDTLTARDPKRVLTQSGEERRPTVAFMFTGQGAQYVNMTLELYQEEPAFRETVDGCVEILQPILGSDLRDILYPHAGQEEQASEKLQQTSITQPALFIIEYALAQLWMSWGIKPQAMIGHSIGEFVAACLSGVFSLENALMLVAIRGRLMQNMPSGSMLAVPLPEHEIAPYLQGNMAIAAVNAPSFCVLSGSHEDVDVVESRFSGQGISCKRLRTSHAFHSAIFDPILEPFANEVKKANPKDPQLPFVSNVTGTWIKASEATDPHYWARHLRHTVRFSDGLKELLKHPDCLLLEVGPGNTLVTFARQHPAKTASHGIVASTRHPNEQASDMTVLLESLGRLWMAGVKIDWQAFHAHETRRRVPLPTYPFEHRHYWTDGGKASYTTVEDVSDLSKIPEITDWFYRPGWKKSPSPQAVPLEPSTCLVFKNDLPVCSAIIDQLQAQGQRVISITAGQKYFCRDDSSYVVSPHQRADWAALVSDLVEANAVPARILHLWTLGCQSEAPDVVLGLGFFSLLFLAQALGDKGIHHPIELRVVADGVAKVNDTDPIQPLKATILGPSRIIPQEFANIRCRCIDVAAHDGDEEVSRQVVQELSVCADEPMIAYRGGERWVEHFSRVRLERSHIRPPKLRKRGVYIVTGGRSGIGLTLAEYLAKTLRARLVLIGRSGLPPREQWNAWLDGHNDHDRTSQTIRTLRVIEAYGGEVHIAQADITKKDEMAAAIQHARERFGTIHGVIHAAGVLNDGLMQLKTAEEAHRVLMPKVIGTLVLDELLQEDNLDFFVLCSSVSSFVGLSGQVDYAAANAFLDAFAHSKAAARKTRMFSINWGQWQQVGMAARLAAELGIVQKDVEPQGVQITHPLLDRCINESSEETEYATLLNSEKLWMLDEHRVKNGESILPGTGYLELVRAAFDSELSGGTVEIRDVFFLSPLVLKDGESKELRIHLKKDGNQADFVIKSCPYLGDRMNWQEHVRGAIGYVEAETPKTYSVERIASQFSRKHEVNGDRRHAHLAFGPRWGNLSWVQYGEGEALLCLELPEDFVGDLADYKLHPALLDMATGSAQSLISGMNPDEAFFVPSSYARLRLHGALPRKIYSHITYRADKGGSDSAVFDVVIMNEDGTEIADITEFMMKKVTNRGAVGVALTKSLPDAQPSTHHHLFEMGYRAGILPVEGIDAFERVLSQDAPQLVVTSQNLHALLNQMVKIGKARPDGTGPSGDTNRPSLTTPYEAPSNEIESGIAEMWQDVLGIESIGIHDDFLELGGHSLLLTQIILRVRKKFGVDLPLTSFFETQTVAGFAEKVAHALQDGTTEQRKSITRVARDAYRQKGSFIFPASHAQQQLWVLHQLEPESPAYHIPFAFQLSGLLNITALQHSLGAIVARHETFRTTFDVYQGELVQIVAQQVEVNLPVIDLSDRPEDEYSREVESLMLADSREAFDLHSGPLFRFSLLRLSSDQHLLLINFHHIILDHTSVLLFTKELTLIYEALSSDKDCPVSEPPIQYADLTIWQGGEDQKAALASKLEYWKEHLGDCASLLELPTDRPRPQQQTFCGAEKKFQLPHKLSDSIRELSRGEKTSLFMTMLAAFNLLLHRYTGQSDIIVGCPFANRNQPELEAIMGCVMNTLPLRTTITGDEAFSTLLAQVKQVTLGALAHQEVSFESIIEALRPTRDASCNPIFQVGFMFQEPPMALELVGLETQSLEIHSGTSKFDMSAWLWDTEDGISGLLEYNSDLFDESTMERLLVHYQTLLEGIVDNPDRSVGKIPILSQEEQQALLIKRNDTTEAYATDRCLHELFEAAAEASPNNVAAIFPAPREAGTDAIVLSYRELDSKANRVANYLIHCGVGQSTCVGIYMHRSPDMLVGLLGILKAGATYIPLDPDFPPDRIQYMIKDSETATVLTQACLLGRLEDSTARSICLDRDWDMIARYSDERPVCTAGPQSLAYVIYTSGSTGRPKGVQIPHRAVVNFLTTMAASRPGFKPDDVLLAVTTISFDISVLEFFLPLSVGGKVVVASRDDAHDGQRLMELLDEQSITVMQATPTTWRLLLQAGWPGTSNLKVLCGGEALPQELAAQLVVRCDELWNMYGPTEMTVWSTMMRIDSADQPISIGQPIGNTQLYILNPHLQPVPVGVAGELHIGGDGLSAGYLNRPELTSAKFILSPFASGGTARLYKTGDLVRWRSDGNLEFLGRIDHQVKVRGFRIELGEIESVLSAHEAIAAVVAVVRDFGVGDKRLIAYFVLHPEADEPTGTDMRQFVRERLPDYMVPSVFVLLDAFPLTPNGKIDRQALPEPDMFRNEGTRDFRAPENETEMALAGIWAAVLGIDAVGLDDNFFELGGHSLLSMQTILQVEKELGVRMNPRDMILQTLEQLAAHCQSLIATQPEDVASINHSALDNQSQSQGKIRSLFKKLKETLEA